MTEPTGYPIPARTHRVEDVVQRSRFVTTLGHAATPEEARAFIDAVRQEFPDATHNCWAFVAGPPGSTAAIGMSDAGEPHGTAGRPMLDVLLHSGVGEVVAVVTRYFGGVKLGKGGLVRAYGGAVQQALASLPRAERVERVEVTVTVDYAVIEPLRRLLEEAGADVLEESYADVVRYRAAVPAPRVARLEAALADVSAGRASVTRGGAA
ncbi:MAG TPA: YigZ family protein [Longimicrobiales bacterium]|nr:YigZ family protein [Longimicrobiales bacterium]